MGALFKTTVTTPQLKLPQVIKKSGASAIFILSFLVSRTTTTSWLTAKHSLNYTLSGALTLFIPSHSSQQALPKKLLHVFKLLPVLSACSRSPLLSSSWKVLLFLAPHPWRTPKMLPVCWSLPSHTTSTLPSAPRCTYCDPEPQRNS